MDIGVLMIAGPGRAAQTAQMVEQLGFDHVCFPDSQNLAPDLAMLQACLRGEAVDRDGVASRIEWLEHARPAKVPLEVAATGRRVIEAAARHADAICFAVGADPAHLGDVLAHARRAARAAAAASLVSLAQQIAPALRAAA